MRELAETMSFPRAIAKWCMENEPREVVELIYHDENMVLTHFRCNYRKAEQILPVSSLFVDASIKERLVVRERILQSYIKKYKHLKSDILKMQDGKCLACGTVLNQNNGIIRRIDCEKKRCFENACIVCSKCNDEYEDFTMFCD